MTRAVDQVIERFPERVQTVRLLYLRDERFRAICEDFTLAISALQRFEQRPDASLRPEVDDYRTLVRELEEELRVHLMAADGP